MTTSIEKISDNERFEHTGDLRITGNIGKNATVIIKKGNLIVDGNIESNSKIILPQQKTKSVISNTFIQSEVSFSFVSTQGARIITVLGNIENNVTISSKGANINVEGNIGANININTQNGDIKVRNLEGDSVLKTMNGDITADNVDNNCSLTTMNGDIKAGNIGSNSYLTTMNGDLKVLSADDSVTLKTLRGSIIVNGVKRKQKGKVFSINPTSTDRTYFASNTNISMVVIGSLLAIAGIAAVVIAFIALDAATFGIAGLVVSGIGLTAISLGIGLCVGAGNNCHSTAYSDPMVISF